jgi:hypothetical protein
LRKLNLDGVTGVSDEMVHAIANTLRRNRDARKANRLAAQLVPSLPLPGPPIQLIQHCLVRAEVVDTFAQRLRWI